MFRVFTCLTVEHNWALVALAGVVCFVASIATVILFHRAQATLHTNRMIWIATAGVAAGFGIWATHFVAMLAYEPGIPIGYNIALTSLSLLAAIALTTLGLSFALFDQRKRSAAYGGAMVGGGIACMHYIGMWAVEMPGHVTWQPDLVAASIAFGMLFGMAAMAIAFRRDNVLGGMTAAAFLTLAIVSHHFTAMGAVTIIPDPLQIVYPFSLSPTSMALAIGAAAITVLGVCIVAALADRRLATKKSEFDSTVAELARRQTLVEQTQQLLRQQNLHFQAALENMQQGLCMFDAGQNLIVCNTHYSDMYELTTEQTRSGVTFQSILECRMANGTCPAAAEEYVAGRLTEVASGKSHHSVNELRDGRVISILHQPMPGGGWVDLHQDITEQKKAEAKIAYMAHHDSLTGLPNRVFFRDRLQAQLRELGQANCLAVLFIDLDRFKSVNDALGHPVGDALLRTAAERLRMCVQDADVVARLGGDEFAIIQATTAQPEGAIRLAQEVVAVMNGPFEVDGHQVIVGASIGVAISPNHGSEADQLLKNADMALYRAKADGRSTFHFFEPEMDADLQARRLLELDLRKALSGGEFEVFYQPIVDVQQDTVSCFEALLRWNHQARGSVPPEEFISIAEDIGLIIPIGEWVFRQACAEASKWPSHVSVAVNVSPAQFRSKSLLSVVLSALASTGLAPQRLEIEITETALLQDRDAAFTILSKLRSLGVRISMDDFGTGYSSLSFLRSFPLNRIKIDRSFIADAVDSPESIAIIRAVSGLAASLNMRTTAEGVETQAQLDRVIAEGCTDVQGYFYSAPRPASQVPALLSSLQQKKKVAA